ncbi:MAG: hypothetical protein HQL22_11670 [Candidatus Omnitrophica bacterium]|nr:hypothetical protein [Candidatus Omnitrophota bacterium]
MINKGFINEDPLALAVANEIGGQDCPVLYLTLNDSKETIVLRLLALQAQLNSSKIKQGLLDKNDWVKLAAGAVTATKMFIYIEDAAKTLDQIEQVVQESILLKA